MNNKYIYLEPSIVRYETHSPSKSITYADLDKFKVFAKQMLEVMDTLTLLKYNAVISNKILEEIVKENPTIPFNVINISNVKIRATASVLHGKITKFISRNLKVVKTDDSCNLSYDFIDIIGTTQDYFLDFLELVLSGCEKTGQATSDIILKDINSINFLEKGYKISCDKSCSESFIKELESLNIYELKEKNKLIIAELELLNSISDYNPEINARQNDHHSVFGSKIMRFDDIPEPEKGFFISLNKIADIKEIIFREYIGTTSEGEAKLYGIYDLECNDPDYSRIKGKFSLKGRGSNPQGCEIELFIKKTPFEKLRECMEARSIRVIDTEILNEYINRV